MTTEVLPPALEEGRLQDVAAWIQAHCQPAAQAMSEDMPDEVLVPPTPFEVRGYQIETWSSIWLAREQGATSAFAALATGLGKTTIAAFDFMKYREECATASRP